MPPRSLAKRLWTLLMTIPLIAMLILVTVFLLSSSSPSSAKRITTANEQQQSRKIPKVIHQSWKTKLVPTKYARMVDSWKSMNPDYEYRIWSDSDNRNLIETHYPWFLEVFDSYEDPILQADASRVFYMHQYGGVYADLDFQCLKPLDTLLGTHDAVLGSMNTGFNFFLRAHSIPNAFMASKPGHPMWITCAQRMMKQRKGTVEQRTGPAMLYRCYSDYIKSNRNMGAPGVHANNSVYLAPKEYIYPYSWAVFNSKAVRKACSFSENSKFDEKTCLELVDPKRVAYAVTFWGHSWE
ncbi:hypothetical protein HDU77_005617 [Chytriomyces hyalinus]|nr:hypothetical protein HDU77_005617 [Chytriomyces hyalinus]